MVIPAQLFPGMSFPMDYTMELIDKNDVPMPLPPVPPVVLFDFFFLSPVPPVVVTQLCSNTSSGSSGIRRSTS